MSTAIESGQRPSLWSYLNFSSPRRRSVSLPTRNSRNDPFEKPDRHSHSVLSNGRATMNSINNKSGIFSNVRSPGMLPSQKSRYIKTGVVLTFIIFLLFIVTPSKRTTVRDFVGSHMNDATGASNASGGKAKCTKPFDRSKPLIQYVSMIDAGSTGSRIHVYRFNNCGPTPELEHEEFKMTEKKEGGSGLSSYKTDAEGAAQSLNVLMDVAMRIIPEEYRSCSPVAVKATAGLRLLGPEMSEKILQAVRSHLETVYPFPVVSKEMHGVEIMDGKDEGVYAWITANYLLGKIGSPEKNPTAAIFDLGGGSTQIVFEPTFKKASAGGMPETLAEGDHKYSLDFGGRAFDLYQHSHLGYGLMSARESIHRALVESIYEASPDNHSWLHEPVLNPCLARGTSRKVVVKLDETHPLGSSISLNMTGPSIFSTATTAQCRGLAERILKKHEECTLSPCSFNGVHQPSLEKTFKDSDVYIFSYFYDRTQPLGMPDSFTLTELRDLTRSVCAGPDAWDIFTSIPDALDELYDRPEWCLDLSFMVALLHTGYEMPLEREVKIAKKINGNELGWCLGASLPLLSQNSGWTCKIKEVTRR